MSTIEEIMNKANELGHLLRETNIYQEFDRLTQEFEADSEAKELLQQYEEKGVQIEQRQKIGDIIENYEIEEIKELAQQINDNDLIMEYLRAKEEYASLLGTIQQAISVNDGDNE